MKDYSLEQALGYLIATFEIWKVFGLCGDRKFKLSIHVDEMVIECTNTETEREYQDFFNFRELTESNCHEKIYETLEKVQQMVK